MRALFLPGRFKLGLFFPHYWIQYLESEVYKPLVWTKTRPSALGSPVGHLQVLGLISFHNHISQFLYI